MIIFKYQRDIHLTDKIDKKLWRIYQKLNEYLYHELHIHAVITSTWRKKTTDSGIHELGRAIDCIPERPVNNEFGNKIAAVINSHYEYGDGKHLTCIWHDAGSGYHWHLQVRN